MIQLITEFEEGQKVYFKTDPESVVYMITGYLVRGKQVMYECSIGGVERVYGFGIELQALEDSE